MAQAGDTVYLQHHNAIRGIILATARDADPINGKISVLSPIGQALSGQQPGNKVQLDTLEGRIEYRIIKII